MIGTCPIVPTGGAFLSGMLAQIDCQAQTIGAGGYQALAAPGSAASIAVTSLLTIFVALFGSRMLLGHTPDVRDGVVATLKIGIVLMLASSWGAYRTVAYDLVLHGPAEIAGTIGEASALPGAGGGMKQRLQNVDDLILYFASVGSGQPLLAAQADLTPIERARVANPLVTDSFAFGVARTSFLVGTIGSLATVRLGGGILLALAPLFAGFLLFDVTRFLFVGWLRALVAVAFGTLAIALLLSIELSVVEPWLVDALSRRAATFATPAAPGELLAITLVFGLTAVAVLALFGRLAFTVHVPMPWLGATRQTSVRGSTIISNMPPSDRQAIRSPPQSRAALISDAVARSDRRDLQMVSAATGSLQPYPAGEPSGARIDVTPRVPVGRQFRRVRPRVSASALRRDR